MTVRVRRLEPGDDRSRFRSGNLELDRFFLSYAGQNQFRHHLGTTYVAVAQEEILGFATVSASELTTARLPAAQRKRLPRYPLPVLRLARLATDERARGTGVGRLLLQSVFELAVHMRDELGCGGVVVDAKAEAIGFYESLGFAALDVSAGELGTRPAATPMFLPISALER